MTRHAVRLALILVLSAGWFLWSVEESSACVCPPYIHSVAEVSARSTSIFIGKVTVIHRSSMSRDELEKLNEPFDAVVAFDVRTVWKGPLYHKRYIKTTERGSCGYYFERDEEYLVYASNGATGICSRTHNTKDVFSIFIPEDGEPVFSDDIAELGISYLPVQGTNEPFPNVPGITGIVGVLPSPTPAPVSTATAIPKPEHTATAVPTPEAIATSTPSPTLTPNSTPSPSGGNGCYSPSSAKPDVAWLAAMAGLVWFGTRQRRW